MSLTLLPVRCSGPVLMHGARSTGAGGRLSLMPPWELWTGAAWSTEYGGRRTPLTYAPRRCSGPVLHGARSTGSGGRLSLMPQGDALDQCCMEYGGRRTPLTYAPRRCSGPVLHGSRSTGAGGRHSKRSRCIGRDTHIGRCRITFNWINNRKAC